MNKETLDSEIVQFSKRRKAFAEITQRLAEESLVAFSSKQFRDLNRQLLLLQKNTRDKFIKTCIHQYITSKLMLSGAPKEEVEYIARKSFENWVSILDQEIEISFPAFIKIANEAFRRKEHELKQLQREKNLKNNKMKKALRGALRLSLSGAVLAYDTLFLATAQNPIAVSTTSYCATVVVFSQSISDFF